MPKSASRYLECWRCRTVTFTDIVGNIIGLNKQPQYLCPKCGATNSVDEAFKRAEDLNANTLQPTPDVVC